MAQTQICRGTATRIFHASGYQCVRYHSTTVVRWNHEEIILNSGGWDTVTTKLRMNQASNQFSLDYHVYQNKHMWYVDFKGQTLSFRDGMILKR